MCLTDAFVNWPGTLLLIGFAMLIGSTYFALKMDYFVMDYQSHRDILVWKDPIVIHTFMQDKAKEYLEKNQKVKKVHQLQQTFVKKWSALILFELDRKGTDISQLGDEKYGSAKFSQKTGFVDYGLLNKEFLENIQSIENSILKNPKWKEVCFVDVIPEDEYKENNYNCSERFSLASPLTMFRYLGIENITAAS